MVCEVSFSAKWLITKFLLHQGSAIDLDMGPPLDDSQTANYKTIQQILLRMNRLCVQLVYGSASAAAAAAAASGGPGGVGGGVGVGPNTKPRKHEQRLLRNMGVHSVRRVPFFS